MSEPQSDLKSFLLQELTVRLGVRFVRASRLRGGDIHEAYCLESDRGEKIFVKASRGMPRTVFEREAEGLAWLSEARALSVPSVLGLGGGDTNQGPSIGYLALEYLEANPEAPNFSELLGLGLAKLHRAQDGPVGLDEDNYIGPLPQSNRCRSSWAEFYAEERLIPMVRRAMDRRAVPPSWLGRFERLGSRIPVLVPDEAPSRLHGDLWAGNVYSGPKGAPFLLDPAVYRGHREVDLAMMRLFGGFSEECFHSYRAAFPLVPGHAERLPLYQLYPLLVHVTLFGGSYVSAAESALRSVE